MTTRSNMTIPPAAAPANPNRRQVRTFALVWTGLTLLIGACTFISIYAATGAAAIGGNPIDTGIASAAISAGTAQASDSTTQTVDASVAPAPTLVAAAATNTAVPATAAPVQAAVATQAATQAISAPTATIVAIKDTDFDLGIAVQDNPDANTYKTWVDMASNQLKLNWIKSQVSWADVEKVKGQIDWSGLDTTVNMMNAANVKVMLSITHAPTWARDKGAATTTAAQEFDGPPANPQDLVDLITAILKRYPGKIQAIEVWNEINLDREWSTAPQQLDPKRYVALLKAAHDAIKAIDPNIIVISAALSPTGANIPGRVIDDFVYFKNLVDAGMLQYADCVGAHHNGINVPPTVEWNNNPERVPRATFRGPWDNPHHSWAFKSTLEGYAKMIKDSGSPLKLCVTEFGWPTVSDLGGKAPAGREYANDNTLADQANFTQQAITWMQQSGTVRLAFVFNLNYGPQAGWSLDPAKGGDNVMYSIIGKDWAVRPVWQKIVDFNFKGQARKASS